MDGHHPLEAGLQHRAGWPGPGELRVALVREDGHPARPAPLRLGGVVAQPPRGVGGRVRPEQEGAGRIGLGDGTEVEPTDPPRRRRNRDGPAPGQRRTHGIRRVGHRRVEHGVPIRTAQAQQVGHRGHELLGADTGRHRRRLDGAEPEPPLQPGRGGVDQQGAPGGHGVAPFTARRGERLDHTGRWRVAGVTDGTVDDPLGEGVGQLAEGGHPVVGVRRERESRRSPRHWPPTTNSANRARPTSSRTTCNVVDSSPSAWPTTSPSRCTAARTSPRAQGT